MNQIEIKRTYIEVDEEQKKANFILVDENDEEYVLGELGDSFFSPVDIKQR